jgi:hypothetical protein
MRSKRRPPAKPAATAATVRTLQRRVRHLERELAAEKARGDRRVESARRAANRRLAAMVQEIATLRHHEARAETLERMLARATSAAGEGRGDGEDPRLPG